MIQIYLYVYMYIDTYFQIILPDRLLQNTEYISLCYPIGPCWLSLAWKIPWTEEPGGLQSMGLLESDMTERLPFHFSPSCIGEGNGNPLQCSCLENPRDRGAWWAAVYGVAQSRTRLKPLSSSLYLDLSFLSECFLIFKYIGFAYIYPSIVSLKFRF